MKTRDGVLGYIERFEERQNRLREMYERHRIPDPTVGFYQERGNAAREILSGLREWWDE